MAYLFNKKSENQLKWGILQLSNGDEHTFKYEELTPRSYSVENDVINSLDYVKALQTIRTTKELPATVGGKIKTETATVFYTIKSITPEVSNAKSRYSKTNADSWVFSLGE